MSRTEIRQSLPCLRPLTSIRRSSMKSNDELPVLIKLCLYPDENYSLSMFRLLFSTRSSCSPNVCDEFSCTALMYCLRYQRFRLFDFLLEETSTDLNLQAKDRHGNNVLHYAVVYDACRPQLINKLIDRWNQYKIDVDQRNRFGFTPLLLAAFCGRYDLVELFLNKTEASIFVRDDFRRRNLLDFISIDRKLVASSSDDVADDKTSKEKSKTLVELQQSLPSKHRLNLASKCLYPWKNFLETVLPRAVLDETDSIRCSFIRMTENHVHRVRIVALLELLGQRYPKMRIGESTNFVEPRTTNDEFLQRKKLDSKANVHEILNLFDPSLRPKINPPKTNLNRLNSIFHPAVGKGPMSFKRLSTRLTTIAAFSRSNNEKKLF